MAKRLVSNALGGTRTICTSALPPTCSDQENSYSPPSAGAGRQDCAAAMPLLLVAVYCFVTLISAGYPGAGAAKSVRSSRFQLRPRPTTLGTHRQSLIFGAARPRRRPFSGVVRPYNEEEDHLVATTRPSEPTAAEAPADVEPVEGTAEGEDVHDMSLWAIIFGSSKLGRVTEKATPPPPAIERKYYQSDLARMRMIEMIGEANDPWEDDSAIPKRTGASSFSQRVR
mmetsp:Transcript_26920/g.67807  ORF Transcript_26920/g.67807 Transcript_26920/m.67807 type:complete len:227 (+) Transcript_26920:384-1064(+)